MSATTFFPGTVSPWAADANPARVVLRPRRSDVASTPPRALRLTRRGRVVVTAGFLAVIGMLAIAFGGTAIGTFDSGTPTPVRVVEVHPGDTLYGLAGTVSKPGHINDMIAEIEQLNSLTTPVLQIGQKIAIPVVAK